MSGDADGRGFREQLADYIRQEATPPYKFGHQPRVYRLTREIAAALEPAPFYDDDIVYAAVYLHDLGVFLAHRPVEQAALETWDSARYACEQAPELLRRFGFPEAKVAAVVECIRDHQPKDDPQHFEATLIRDADILEQLGAVAVMRTAAKLGSDTRFVHMADARDALRRALDTLPDRIRLDATRGLALARVEALREFLWALEAEAGDDLG